MQTASDENLTIEETKDVIISLSNQLILILIDVLFVPDLIVNLINTSRLWYKRIIVSFSSMKLASLRYDSQLVAHADNVNDQFLLRNEVVLAMYEWFSVVLQDVKEDYWYKDLTSTSRSFEISQRCCKCEESSKHERSSWLVLEEALWDLSQSETTIRVYSTSHVEDNWISQWDTCEYWRLVVSHVSRSSLLSTNKEWRLRYVLRICLDVTNIYY